MVKDTQGAQRLGSASLYHLPRTSLQLTKPQAFLLPRLEDEAVFHADNVLVPVVTR